MTPDECFAFAGLIILGFIVVAVFHFRDSKNE
jgi:hypothetical protein